jgi:predicted GNAT family N-acyltransferase
MKLSDYFYFPNITFEPIKEEEIDETISLINNAFDYQNKIRGKTRTNPENFRKHYFGKTDFYVMRENGKIIGCRYIEPRGDSLHLGMLALDEAHRGTGLAQAGMKAVIDYAQAAGYEKLELDYMSVAPWLKKYNEKYGFKETGETQDWDGIKLIRMEKQLT